MNNLVSVIIPVYNVEQYIRQCIDSVINQTYKHLEIILVDDGSMDNSGKICDEYALKDSRIKVIHKENGGVSSARNAGLDVAKGDYIGFVDGDDYVEEDMYEILLKTIIENNSQLVVCNWFIGTENSWIKNKQFPTKQTLTIFEAMENFYWCMYSWNKLFDKKILNSTHFNEKYNYGEDTLFCFDIFNKLKEIHCINLCKYYYRQNPNSALNAHKFKKQYLGCIDIIDIEIEYATRNNLNELKNKLHKSKMSISTAFLGFIALEDNPDIESAKILLKYIKKICFVFFKTDAKISKKCFILLACINFNLASKIYKLIYRK